MLKRITCAVAMMLFGSIAQAQQVTTGYDGNGDATTYLEYSAVAQTFTALGSDVAGGGFRMRWDCAISACWVDFPSTSQLRVVTGTIRFSLWDANPGSAGANRLASVVQPYAFNAWNSRFVDAFWTPVNVNVGQVYWLVAGEFEPDEESRWEVRVFRHEPFPPIDQFTGGNAYAGATDESLFVRSGSDAHPMDYHFRIWSTVPEPSTYALMSIGLIAMGVAARRRRVNP